MMPENRIRELDAARGFCILAMVAVHLIYDLTELYPVLNWQYPPVFLLIKNGGGIVFFLISGISATLGRRHLRRGVIVFVCGLLAGAVTVLAGYLPIRFGVLHCLGLCMLLWELFKGASQRALWGFCAAFVVLGRCFSRIPVTATFLYPLGLTAPGFQSADYFPLLPYFGYFLAGAALGKRFYPTRESLFPKLPRLSLFCYCGTHSLFLYLIHQPVLIFLIEAAISLGGILREIYYET